MTSWILAEKEKPPSVWQQFFFGWYLFLPGTCTFLDLLTTNLEFSKWGGIFTDDQMAAAMIDRLVHHGHLILFEGNSYRMEHALMKQTARQLGTGAESKDSTLNAKRSGSLWHKRTRITLLGRKQWMLLSFLLDKGKNENSLHVSFG